MPPAPVAGSAQFPAPMVVPRIEPVRQHMYLSPGASELKPYHNSAMPECPPGCVRVVCISDTHSEHAGLRLPAGDVLLHTGDVLTESGIRRDRVALKLLIGDDGGDPVGLKLLEDFADWFGDQPFAHKVLIGGNHDSTLEHLGKARVQQILSDRCNHGKVVYLQDGCTTVGALRIYGSPYAHFTSHNNAFSRANPSYKIPAGVHIVATHVPAVFPLRSGEPRQYEEITEPAIAAGALLHVSGHIHWANGLYFARLKAEGGALSCGPEAAKALARGATLLPCVVASVCSSDWWTGTALKSAAGTRGDARDQYFGGFMLTQPGVVCDVCVAPAKLASFKAPLTTAAVALGCADQGVASERPSLLFFCPPTDAALVEQLLPRLRRVFGDSGVLHVETAEEGVRAVGSRDFAACIATLGYDGNRGRDVIAALRSAQGRGPHVIIHSSNGYSHEPTRTSLTTSVGVDHFTKHGREDELLQYLESRFRTQAADGGPTPGGGAPRALVFGPPNDPDFLPALLPKLEGAGVEVDVVTTVHQGFEAVEGRRYCACVAKLGMRGNFGVDVIAAFRAHQGPAAFVAVHSAMAAGDPTMQASLTSRYGIDLFVQHGQESAVAEAVRSVVACGQLFRR